MRRVRAMGPAVRIAASIAMLAVLISRLHLSGLLPARHHSAVAFLLVALMVTLTGIILSALRWQRVLVALELPTRVRTAINLYLAGLFVGNFLPSTVGGDVVRISRLARLNGERTGPFASVVLERLTGWLVLPVITLAALLANPGLLHLGPATRLAVAVSLVTLFLLVVMTALAGHPRLGGRLARRQDWVRFVGAVHLGLDRFRRRPAAAIEVLAVAFAYQLAVALAAFLAAAALNLDVGWTAILAFMPVVAIVQVLPVTIGGLGLREGAFILFLGPLGVSTSQAIALGLLVYFLNLAVSLLGAPAFAAGVRANRAAS
ncbi:MAG TPA: lysylphosphatidylglycerol synthase transmembrane domain-containing protein [Acidimicrobiales bacterium]|nr:lysylphosphatidylglycerol synthase transmembrane domain-containing protein [Acidimicrobiales bacterium]